MLEFSLLSNCHKLLFLEIDTVRGMSRHAVSALVFALAELHNEPG